EVEVERVRVVEVEERVARRLDPVFPGEVIPAVEDRVRHAIIGHAYELVAGNLCVAREAELREIRLPDAEAEEVSGLELVGVAEGEDQLVIVRVQRRGRRE